MIGFWFIFFLQSETLLDLLGGSPEPEPTPAPVQPPAPAASSGGELLDLLGDLDLGSTNAGLCFRQLLKQKQLYTKRCKQKN